MQLKENTTLQDGRFRIIRCLGKGGFGITYLAEDRMLRVNVAIKEFFISQHCNRDEYGRVSIGVESMKTTINSYYEKFINEAGKIRKLKHPNIVSVYDVFTENGTAYYTMDYHSNGSLSALVKKQSRLSEDDALRYIRQIASALKYIHSCNMVHLDVKPDNILLDSNGNAILIDFGISKHYDSEGKATTITPGAYTPGYAAGSQIAGSKINTFSPSLDIYSLGATLYNLVTGKEPPIVDYIYNNSFPPFPAEVSANTCLAIKKSMSPKSLERPQSVDEFLGLLEGSKLPKEPFNWKIPTGIVATLLCIVFSWLGIKGCNDYRAEQARLDAIEKARLDSIAIVKHYNDSIAAVKHYNDSIAAVKRYNDSVAEANMLGKLFINTNPSGATVTIDGKRIGTTPINGYEQKKGTYTVKITKEGYKGYSTKVKIAAEPFIINEVLSAVAKKESTEKKTSKQDIEKYYNDGLKAYDAGNYTEAAKWWRKAAEQGYAEAQLRMWDYIFNENRDNLNAKKIKEAEYWLRKAAEQGHVVAQYALGTFYDESAAPGYVKNEEAVKWYRKAAEQGYADAQNDLGRCYDWGIGVEKNLTEAVKWYRKAAEQGHTLAQENFINCCYELGNSYYETDITIASICYEAAAKRGHADAQFKLGYYQYEILHNAEEGIKWYRKAAEQGHTDAQLALKRLNK